MEPWSPDVHCLWPLSFRLGVRLMLLVDSRSRTMPTELWLHMLSFCGCDWFQSSEEAAVVEEERDDEDEEEHDVKEAVRSSKRRKI